MYINFEFLRTFEDPVNGTGGVTRDYRITNDSAVTAALKAGLAKYNQSVQWAVQFVPGLDPLTIGGGQSPQPQSSSVMISPGLMVVIVLAGLVGVAFILFICCKCWFSKY